MKKTCLHATWIAGIISRKTGDVYLQVIPNRESYTFQHFYDQHVEPGAMVITDGWSYGKFLDTKYHHYVCKKVSVPGHTIEEPYDITDKKFGKISIHTNTIEGYWSELRAKLHWSRGWPATYMDYVLAELMYRKKNIPLLTALEIK
jgi:hypothetical protein